jgi:hypothetical protein
MRSWKKSYNKSRRRIWYTSRQLLASTSSFNNNDVSTLENLGDRRTKTKTWCHASKKKTFEFQNDRRGMVISLWPTRKPLHFPRSKPIGHNSMIIRGHWIVRTTAWVRTMPGGRPWHLNRLAIRTRTTTTTTTARRAETTAHVIDPRLHRCLTNRDCNI